eukprot:313654_1
MTLLHLILLLFIYSLFQITISISSSNQYETDNDTYWKSTSFFQPSQGNIQTESPAIATTTTTTDRPTNRPIAIDDFDVEVTIFMDYNANNNTNKTKNNQVIRDITEDIINNYIHNISNGSNN